MIVVETFLICDGGCVRNYGVDTRGKTGKQHRESAKLDGWAVIKGKDYCPMCKPMVMMSPREKRNL